MKNKVTAFIFSVIFMFSAIMTAFASGDGNVDSGGGEMGIGTITDFWTPGNDGVRVSVIDVETGAVLGRPIDYTNITPPTGMMYFDQKSKIHYLNGAGLSALYGVYNYNTPSVPLPRIYATATATQALRTSSSIFAPKARRR